MDKFNILKDVVKSDDNDLLTHKGDKLNEEDLMNNILKKVIITQNNSDNVFFGIFLKIVNEDNKTYYELIKNDGQVIKVLNNTVEVFKFNK